MWFVSDNAAPAAPEVMGALAHANDGCAPAYGAEAAMAEVTARVRAVFEAPEAAVHLVATGTAANALALACLCPPWAAVFCHAKAHIAEDECGAVGFHSGGATLSHVAGPDARLDPDALAAAIGATALIGVHNVQRGAVSITNATERGAVYSVEEVRRICAIAAGFGLPVHMDGARFANALAALGCTPAELTWKAGIGALSFGATKNGCLGVEAVVLFDPARAWELELRRKRSGHLVSKHRYLSAQMAAYLQDDLWLRLARTANARAARLAAGLRRAPGVRILHPPDANMTFAELPAAAHDRAQAAGAQYYFEPVPGEEAVVARLVCHWATTEAEVDGLLALLGAEEVAERA